ncbi:MAG: hypothetical protein P8N19_01445 [Flavobacteriales bacterium]|nr:hypothetical protein [Flavobacteriales bacterium]
MQSYQAKLFSVNSRLDFGKFKGKEIQKVIEQDHTYVLWCLKNVPSFFICPSMMKLLIGVTWKHLIDDVHEEQMVSEFLKIGEHFDLRLEHLASEAIREQWSNNERKYSSVTVYTFAMVKMERLRRRERQALVKINHFQKN